MRAVHFIQNLVLLFLIPFLAACVDSNFGDNGMALTEVDAYGQPARLYARDAVVQYTAEGAKLVTAGRSLEHLPTNLYDGNFYMLRYEMNGQLDSTFGDSGVVTTNFATYQDSFGSPRWTNESIQRVKALDDGRLLAVGTVTAVGMSGAVGMIRYEEDGTIDTSFGLSGMIMDPLGDANSPLYFEGPFPEGNRYVDVSAAEVMDDGKILVAGQVSGDLFVARYHANGYRDHSFATGGLFEFAFEGSNDPNGSFEDLFSLEVRQSGQIDLVGRTGSYVSGSYHGQMLVLRLTADGELTQQYGPEGYFVWNGDQEVIDQLRVAFLDAESRLLLIGRDSGNDADFRIVRVAPDGNLDPSFGTNGVARIDFESLTGYIATHGNPLDATLDAQGRLIIVGFSGAGTEKYAVGVRLTEAGQIDQSPHNGALAIFAKKSASDSRNDAARAVEIGPSQQIFVSGSSESAGRNAESSMVMSFLNGW